MQNINIGKSGIAVPFLGMGTWAIGGGAWWGDNDDALSVKAMVPLSEMFGYVTALRTITSGRATSSMEYDHHAPLSATLQEQVLADLKR